MFKIIGEVLLYGVSLPLIAFQAFMGLDSFIDLLAQLSEYGRIK